MNDKVWRSCPVCIMWTNETHKAEYCAENRVFLQEHPNWPRSALSAHPTWFQA